jgi:hypothetical protein
MNPKPFRVIPCTEWGAHAPRAPIQLVNRKPVRALFHHTAGHHAELDGDHSTESYRESVGYAKAIQNYHMNGNGWNDSGHNFLVTRSGYIFEGRHRSLEMVARGKMVVSAHCPGQNEQPGVEIEHNGSEPMTAIQNEAAVWLFAWLCQVGGFPASSIAGHRDFYATACPGALYPGLPQFRNAVGRALAPPSAPPTHVYKTTITDSAGKLTVWRHKSIRLAGQALARFDKTHHNIVRVEIERQK